LSHAHTNVVPLPCTLPCKITPSSIYLFVFYMPRAIKKPRGSKKRCPICENDFYPQAFGAHVKKCERTKRAQDGLREYDRQMKERLYADLSKLPPGASKSVRISNAPGDPDSAPVLTDLTAPEIEIPRPDAAPPTDAEPSADAAPPADVVGCRHTQAGFNTQEDFQFSEILHQGHLSRDLSERLIKLVNLCLSGNGVHHQPLC